MKNLTTLFFSLVIAITSFSQSPSWVWAKQFGFEGYDRGISIKTDVIGNVYMVGNYESDSISFGSITIQRNDSLTGILGKFLCKLDPSGNVIWVKDIVGGGYVTDMDIDEQGNCYVTGHFAVFQLSFGNDTLISVGGYDIFVLKYDSNGNELWGKIAGGDGNDYPYSIDVDTFQNIYIAGQKGNNIVYFGGDTLLGTSSEDMLVLKFDSAGNELWGRNTGAGFNRAQSIAADNYGSVYVLGNFTANQVFIGTFTLTNNNGLGGSNDVYIVRFSSNGDVIWAEKAGGTSSDGGQSLAVDKAGDIIISGTTGSSTFTYSQQNLVAGSGQMLDDIFVLKLDSNANMLWSKRIGGAIMDNGGDIALDLNDNIYLSGRYYSDPIIFDVDTLQNSGASDIYIVKYTSSGVQSWTVSAGGEFADIVGAVTVDQQGNTYVCGHYYSDSINFSSNSIYLNGLNDGFVAKLGSASSVRSINTISEIMTVYPNPFNCKIQLANLTPGSKFTLTNSLGQTIWTGLNIEQHNFLDIPPGYYLLKIKTETSEFTQKLIKQ